MTKKNPSKSSLGNISLQLTDSFAIFCSTFCLAYIIHSQQSKTETQHYLVSLFSFMTSIRQDELSRTCCLPPTASHAVLSPREEHPSRTSVLAFVSSFFLTLQLTPSPPRMRNHSFFSLMLTPSKCLQKHVLHLLTDPQEQYQQTGALRRCPITPLCCSYKADKP